MPRQPSGHDLLRARSQVGPLLDAEAGALAMDLHSASAAEMSWKDPFFDLGGAVKDGQS